MLKVPEAFAERRIAVSGSPGRHWIEALPSLVAELCKRWDLEINGDPMTGELGLVVPVSRGTEPLILKVSWPDVDSKDEALALRAWRGHGAVQLYEHDVENWAMLMERANHLRPLALLPNVEAASIAGRLLRKLAITAPNQTRTQKDLLQGLRTSLVEDSERLKWPVPRDVVNRALRLMEPADFPEALLINTDLHYGNILGAEREPWLAIDPKVVSGVVEFGIAPLFWNLHRRALRDELGHLFAVLVEAAEVDPDVARAWTYIRIVDYWIWAVKTGLTEDPRMCAALLSRLD